MYFNDSTTIFLADANRSVFSSLSLWSRSPGDRPSLLHLDGHRIEFSVPVETANEFLKLIIVEVAESGERNPLRIADLAIARMRKLVKASDSC